MKMHPKPMLRHTQHVEPVTTTASYEEQSQEPFHLMFSFTDGRFSRLTMTRSEASHLYAQLAVMLRYDDKPAGEIDPEEWNAFMDTINGALEGKFS